MQAVRVGAELNKDTVRYVSSELGSIGVQACGESNTM